jgi:hypothetical protein
VERFICHCFACDNHEQANDINKAIGNVFQLIAQEKDKDGGMRVLQERSRKFEESQLLALELEGNLLSASLDRGEGVDADEAMAVRDGPLILARWQQPTEVLHGCGVVPLYSTTHHTHTHTHARARARTSPQSPSPQPPPV